MHTYYVLGKNIYNVPGKWQRPEVFWALNIWFDCHFCSPSVVEVMENSSGACSFPWADPAKDKIKVTFIFFHLVPISLTLLSSLISEQRINSLTWQLIWNYFLCLPHFPELLKGTLFTWALPLQVMWLPYPLNILTSCKTNFDKVHLKM